MAPTITATSTSTQTVVPFSITTTFTTPTQCAQSIGGLTILEDDQFEIWLNHPLPVPDTTITSCFPTQFMSSFLLQTGGVSQAAFSQLVCPAGYATQGPYTSNYIACCPSGWGFAPAPNPPSDRPAFGGTCTTNIFNIPVRITSYDNQSIKASSIFTATHSLDQAFALLYEGFALGVAVVASTTPTRSQPTRSSSSSTDFSQSDASSTRNPGAVAGAVIGTVLGALILAGILAIMIDYRRKRMSGRNQNGRFPDYASHIRLASPSPTPMVYLSQPPPAMTGSFKVNDQGQVNQYDGEGAYYELEAKNKRYEAEVKKTVYELDGQAGLTITKTKKLPHLPPS